MCDGWLGWRLLNIRFLEKADWKRDLVLMESSSWPLAVKRLMDFGTALTVLMFIWPILLTVGLLIRLTTQGPALYRGIRTGRNGRLFRILKFRTMVLNAEALGGPTTGSNDSRVTRLGKFLRATKLDELPQFINVLLGDMSLVGPRPEVPQYTRQYHGEEKLILTVRPGITDYSSIEFADLDYRVGSEDPDAYFREHILPRKNALRVKYVKEWSLGSDIHILCLTAGTVVKRAWNR